jgi:hypothetical protein
MIDVDCLLFAVAIRENSSCAENGDICYKCAVATKDYAESCRCWKETAELAPEADWGQPTCATAAGETGDLVERGWLGGIPRIGMPRGLGDSGCVQHVC